MLEARVGRKRMCGGPERYRHGCSLGVAPASAVDDM